MLTLLVTGLPELSVVYSKFTRTVTVFKQRVHKEQETVNPSMVYYRFWQAQSARVLRYAMFQSRFDVLQVICHGIPDKRPLEDGDIVNVDVTAYYKGYHGDLNETYCVGQVDDASKKLIRCAHDVS